MLYQLRQRLSPFRPYKPQDPLAERRAGFTAVIFLVLLVIIPIGMLVRYWARCYILVALAGFAFTGNPAAIFVAGNDRRCPCSCHFSDGFHRVGTSC